MKPSRNSRKRKTRNSKSINPKEIHAYNALHNFEPLNYRLQLDLNSIIKAHIDRINQLKDILHILPDDNFCVRNYSGKPYYYSDITRNRKRTRRGLNRKPMLLGILARKTYLEAELEVLEGNLEYLLLEREKYKEPSAGNVLEMIDSNKFGLPDSVFTGQHESFTEWALNYEQDDRHSEHNVIPTNTGIRVKSKTEKDILERLHLNGIEFRYEQVHYFGPIRIAPDFTIRKGDEIIIWEHFGKMDDPRYVNTFRRKLETYIQNGFIPGKNLIITFEGGGQYLSSEEIDAIIKSKLM